MTLITAPIRAEALALKAQIALNTPPGMLDTWVSVAAWFWLKTDEPGVGGGAQAYDEIGHAGGFSFPLKPVIPYLSNMRMFHPHYPKRQPKSLKLSQRCHCS